MVHYSNNVMRAIYVPNKKHILSHQLKTDNSVCLPLKVGYSLVHSLEVSLVETIFNAIRVCLPLRRKTHRMLVRYALLYISEVSMAGNTHALNVFVLHLDERANACYGLSYIMM